MGARERTSTYVSMQVSESEKSILDAAAKAAGMNRNRFIRRWIASLTIDGGKSQDNRPGIG